MKPKSHQKIDLIKDAKIPSEPLMCVCHRCGWGGTEDKTFHVNGTYCPHCPKYKNDHNSLEVFYPSEKPNYMAKIKEKEEFHTKILKDLKEKQGIEVESSSNIKALINYVKHLGYSEGYKDGKNT
jgi:hypothetical protein